MHILETENLTKYYGKSRGIVDVNLRLEEGEIFGFIGPNGAGKTTTIRLLLNFLFPTRGRARIFGLDVVADAREIKRQVGYLPGEVAYYGELQVKDLLAYSSSFYPHDCTRRGQELADILGLELDRRIETLSLGNKKKVGIVQALMHEPRLLILDEPTSGLDPLVQKRFYELLLEENRRGVTIFLSSHVLSEVQRLCSRVAILKQGQVVRVEEIGALRSRQLRKVQVTFKNPNEAFPEGLKGVVDVEKEDGIVRFLYSGSIDALVKALAQIEIVDLQLEEPTLEEIFLHYYGNEEEVAR